MKPKILLFVLVSGCLLACESKAGVRDAIITWTGDAGYRARVTMSYDDAFPSLQLGAAVPLAGLRQTKASRSFQSRSLVRRYSRSSRQTIFPTARSTTGSLTLDFK